MDRVRTATDKPLSVGFGISSTEQVKEVAGIADGVVVGSAFMNAVDEVRTLPALRWGGGRGCRAGYQRLGLTMLHNCLDGNGQGVVCRVTMLVWALSLLCLFEFFCAKYVGWPRAEESFFVGWDLCTRHTLSPLVESLRRGGMGAGSHAGDRFISPRALCFARHARTTQKPGSSA